MGRNLGHLLREYPIPLMALTGLLVGAVARGLGQPEAGRWVWLGALILGGAPLAIQTTAGMLRGRFNADIVALLAIVAALGMGEAFAGVIIVLMQSGGEALE